MLGGPAALWVVSRPSAAGSRDQLLHLELDSGRELGRAQVGGVRARLECFTQAARRRRCPS